MIPTQDDEVLLTFARRMLALRDEAWAAVVRPEATGRVAMGVADDYASLLPSILKKFSATCSKVEIQVVGLSSVALALMVKDGSADLACGTRGGAARCAVPAHLTLLGQMQGMPENAALELILARSAKSKRPPCDFLAEKIMLELRR